MYVYGDKYFTYLRFYRAKRTFVELELEGT